MSTSTALVPVVSTECDVNGKCKRPADPADETSPKEDPEPKPKQKRQKKSRIVDILKTPEPVEFKAELLLIEYGHKAISRLISEGFVDQGLFTHLTRLAKVKNYDLNLRKVASDYICFLPILRVLRDIGLDLSYEDDFLLRLAVKWRRPATVQFLLKSGANPTVMNGQPLMDAYMPSAQSKEPDAHIFSILLGAITNGNLTEIPDKLLNKLIKDKNYAIIEILLTKMDGQENQQLSNTFKKLIESSELDHELIRSFLVHQTKLVEGFVDIMKTKTGLYTDPDTFALLLDHGIRLIPSEQMKKHVDPYCQRMLETDIGEQI